ncbi:chaplin [Streptomyces cylindrosporus]|uniref:Chaplin n=1 Tax=Streptomyces cylindrosporus TaxID=2927583 RepID=A0ABS9YM25_9ACTN|nr:chaplin [Streptomyces cylindrosporus]MCI3278322.1 chaplin [Streptomyces cylindrosporus]
MRRVTRNGVLAVAAASGAMALTAPAQADSSADGATAGSPGPISGNTVQLPVHVPVNVCGNTVNVAGLLDPAAGNSCADEGGHKAPDGPASHGGEASGSEAHGSGKDSPGVLSGNGVQLPVHLPVNVSGNTVSVVGAGNASVGNESVNTPGDHPTGHTPEPSTPPRSHPRPGPGDRSVPEHPVASLAHTGTDEALPTAVTGAALVLGGFALRRRFRAAR